jgi:hypothetical protein
VSGVQAVERHNALVQSRRLVRGGARAQSEAEMRLLHDHLLAAILIAMIVVGVAVLVFASRLDRGDAAPFMYTIF